MNVFLYQGKRGVVASQTNAAVNNIARRAVASNLNEAHLFIRLHTETFENGAIRRYDPGTPTPPLESERIKLRTSSMRKHP